MCNKTVILENNYMSGLSGWKYMYDGYNVNIIALNEQNAFNRMIIFPSKSERRTVVSSIC